MPARTPSLVITIADFTPRETEHPAGRRPAPTHIRVGLVLPGQEPGYHIRTGWRMPTARQYRTNYRTGTGPGYRLSNLASYLRSDTNYSMHISTCGSV